MGHGQTVFPQKIVQTFSFHLMLNTCSGRSESSYFTFDALNFPLIMSLSDPFLYYPSFHSNVVNLGWGNLFSTWYMHDKCMNM